MTALVGGVATGTSAAPAAAGAGGEAWNGRYDFDTVYNRVGTDCVKWDQQIKLYGKQQIAVGMGIADMDFRVAPAITRALAARIQHENHGYLSMPASHVESIVNWNRRRYGVAIDPGSILAGSSYGTGGAGRMRMNIGTSRKLLELALTNISSALKKA